MQLDPSTRRSSIATGASRASRAGLTLAAGLVLLGGLVAATGSRSLSDAIVVIATGIALVSVVLGLLSLPRTAQFEAELEAELATASSSSTSPDSGPPARKAPQS